MFDGLQGMLRQRIDMSHLGHPMPYKQMPEMKQMIPFGGVSGAIGAAARDFPGRTNYGVPEDDMIDSPMGYMTPHQYNGISPVSQGSLQRTRNPQFQQSPHSEGSDIQGRPNWGEIPLQGSRGVRPIQPTIQGSRIQNANPQLRLR